MLHRPLVVRDICLRGPRAAKHINNFVEHMDIFSVPRSEKVWGRLLCWIRQESNNKNAFIMDVKQI